MQKYCMVYTRQLLLVSQRSNLQVIEIREVNWSVAFDIPGTHKPIKLKNNIFSSKNGFYKKKHEKSFKA